MGARARGEVKSINRPRAARDANASHSHLPGRDEASDLCDEASRKDLHFGAGRGIMYLLTKENHMIIFYIAIFFSVLLIINFSHGA